MHRSILMLLLREIDNPNPEEGDLVDFILRFLGIELQEGAIGISAEDRHKLFRDLLKPLIEVIILVLQEYGIVESRTARASG